MKIFAFVISFCVACCLGNPAMTFDEFRQWVQNQGKNRLTGYHTPFEMTKINYCSLDSFVPRPSSVSANTVIHSVKAISKPCIYKLNEVLNLEDGQLLRVVSAPWFVQYTEAWQCIKPGSYCAWDIPTKGDTMTYKNPFHKLYPFRTVHNFCRKNVPLTVHIRNNMVEEKYVEITFPCGCRCGLPGEAVAQEKLIKRIEKDESMTTQVMLALAANKLLEPTTSSK